MIERAMKNVERALPFCLGILVGTLLYQAVHGDANWTIAAYMIVGVVSYTFMDGVIGS